jgi:uncharacterized protein (DUF4415 family)
MNNPAEPPEATPTTGTPTKPNKDKRMKKKVSLSLDADLVEELLATGRPLSPQVNEAIRALLKRRRRSTQAPDSSRPSG